MTLWTDEGPITFSDRFLVPDDTYSFEESDMSFEVRIGDKTFSNWSSLYTNEEDEDETTSLKTLAVSRGGQLLFDYSLYPRP